MKRILISAAFIAVLFALSMCNILFHEIVAGHASLDIIPDDPWVDPSKDPDTIDFGPEPVISNTFYVIQYKPME
jgi:hypothetical protein